MDSSSNHQASAYMRTSICVLYVLDSSSAESCVDEADEALSLAPSPLSLSPSEMDIVDVDEVWRDLWKNARENHLARKGLHHNIDSSLYCCQRMQSYLTPQSVVAIATEQMVKIICKHQTGISLAHIACCVVATVGRSDKLGHEGTVSKLSSGDRSARLKALSNVWKPRLIEKDIPVLMPARVGGIGSITLLAVASKPGSVLAFFLPAASVYVVTSLSRCYVCCSDSRDMFKMSIGVRGSSHSLRFPRSKLLASKSDSAIDAHELLTSEFSLDELASAVSIAQRTVDLLPYGSPIESTRLQEFEKTLGRRFRSIACLDDLESIIAVVYRAEDFTPAGHPDKAVLVRLRDLGIALRHHFERVGGSGDSGIAVPLYRHALELRPDAHATELGRASYLEVSLHRHVQESMGSVSDLDAQPLIGWDERLVLVDFLIDLHFRCRMRREVLYLCWNIIDRYMTRRIIAPGDYKLLGCSALWIAAKAMDNNSRVPSAEELSRCCRYRYYSYEFVNMEANILQTLGWILRYPTAEEWLQMLCHSPAPHNEEVDVLHSARFIMEITLYYREFIGYAPSAIALGSLTLARHVCGKKRRVLEETKECLEVVQHLDDRLSEIDEVELSEILIEKYSSDYYLNAAARVVEYYELQGGRFIGDASALLLTSDLTATQTVSEASKYAAVGILPC